jgi:hypothetical protein
MINRRARRAAWFILRILASMERQLRCLQVQQETLPYTITEWREACQAFAPTALAGGLEATEEDTVRAWVQAILDELQGILGRNDLRRMLRLRPGVGKCGGEALGKTSSLGHSSKCGATPSRSRRLPPSRRAQDDASEQDLGRAAGPGTLS